MRQQTDDPDTEILVNGITVLVGLGTAGLMMEEVHIRYTPTPPIAVESTRRLSFS